MDVKEKATQDKIDRKLTEIMWAEQSDKVPTWDIEGDPLRKRVRIKAHCEQDEQLDKVRSLNVGESVEHSLAHRLKQGVEFETPEVDEEGYISTRKVLIKVVGNRLERIA